MRTRPFKQVDVFTATPYLGNPLAVVLDGTGLSSAQMQQFTDWTNLSECTFVLPPTEAGLAAGADYRVRIFCPGRELPFAGHPTLGTCHAWLEAGGQPRGEHIVQECALGLVPIRREILPGVAVGAVSSSDAPRTRLAFAAPPLLKSGPLSEEDVTLIARGLGVTRAEIIAHAWCDNGPNWRGVMLSSAEQVLALRPDAAILGRLDIGVVGPCGKLGVAGACSEAAEASGAEVEAQPAFEVRAFFPGNQGLAEDPVTGSLNAALAQWLIGAGIAPERYVVSQGAALGRAGRVFIDRVADGTIWVGGTSVTCIDGQVGMPAQT